MAGERSARKTSAVGWDGLSVQERRCRLEAMEPDAVRAFAASMPVVEQAKGVVMGWCGVDAASAFAVLVRLSSIRNVKLRVVAADVVAAVGSRSGSPQGLLHDAPEQVRRLLLNLHDLPAEQDRDQDRDWGGEVG